MVSNEARAEAFSRANVEKSLWALKQEQVELTNKLAKVKRARDSAEAGLKTTERQVEDQH